MTKSEITALLVLYGQRYGSFTMEKETMEIWMEKLGHLDHAETREVFIDLIGEKDKSWGWRKVFEMLAVRFSPDDAQAALEKQWQLNPTKPSIIEKQKELGAYMRGLISDVEDRKRRQLPKIDWVTAYAAKHVQVMGRDEAQRTVERLMLDGGRNETEEDFVQAVRQELR